MQKSIWPCIQTLQSCSYMVR